LRLGYFQMTMLDPHPARNRTWLFTGLAELLNGTGVSTIGGFSFDSTSLVSRNAARAMLAFQALARDPAVTVPAHVDKAEVFFHRLPWFETPVDGFEFSIGLNPWGNLLTDILNRSNKPIAAIDISNPPVDVKVGHSSVQVWYIEAMLPPLGP